MLRPPRLKKKTGSGAATKASMLRWLLTNPRSMANPCRVNSSSKQRSRVANFHARGGCFQRSQSNGLLFSDDVCVGREHWQTLDSSKDIESIWKHDIEPTNSIGDCTRLQKYSYVVVSWFQPWRNLWDSCGRMSFGHTWWRAHIQNTQHQLWRRPKWLQGSIMPDPPANARLFSCSWCSSSLLPWC